MQSRYQDGFISPLTCHHAQQASGEAHFNLSLTCFQHMPSICHTWLLGHISASPNQTSTRSNIVADSVEALFSACSDIWPVTSWTIINRLDCNAILDLGLRVLFSKLDCDLFRPLRIMNISSLRAYYISGRSGSLYRSTCSQDLSSSSPTEGQASRSPSRLSVHTVNGKVLVPHADIGWLPGQFQRVVCTLLRNKTRSPICPTTFEQ